MVNAIGDKTIEDSHELFDGLLLAEREMEITSSSDALLSIFKNKANSSPYTSHSKKYSIWKLFSELFEDRLRELSKELSIQGLSSRLKPGQFIQQARKNPDGLRRSITQLGAQVDSSSIADSKKCYIYYELDVLVSVLNIVLSKSSTRNFVTNRAEKYTISNNYLLPWQPCEFHCYNHFCQLCWRNTEYFSELTNNSNFLERSYFFNDKQVIETLVRNYVIADRTEKEYQQSIGKTYKSKSLRYCNVHATTNPRNKYHKDNYYRSSFANLLEERKELLVSQLQPLEGFLSVLELRKRVSIFRENIYFEIREPRTILS